MGFGWARSKRAYPKQIFNRLPKGISNCSRNDAITWRDALIKHVFPRFLMPLCPHSGIDSSILKWTSAVCDFPLFPILFLFGEACFLFPSTRFPGGSRSFPSAIFPLGVSFLFLLLDVSPAALELSSSFLFLFLAILANFAVDFCSSDVSVGGSFLLSHIQKEARMAAEAACSRATLACLPTIPSCW